MTGALLSDLGPPTSAMEVRDVLAPVWLAPFLAGWARPSRAASLGWRAVHLLVAQFEIAGTGAAPAAALAVAFADCVAVTLAPIDRSGQSRSRREPCGYVAPDDALGALQMFEQRSYVPASAQSRVAGAGAGLLDND
jgi:hypothetical protein